MYICLSGAAGERRAPTETLDPEEGGGLLALDLEAKLQRLALREVEGLLAPAYHTYIYICIHI